MSIIVHTDIKCIILKNWSIIISIVLYPYVVFSLVEENDRGSLGIMFTIISIYDHIKAFNSSSSLLGFFLSYLIL